MANYNNKTFYTTEVDVTDNYVEKVKQRSTICHRQRKITISAKKTTNTKNYLY